MKDEFKAQFIVELDRQAILEALAKPIEGFQTRAEDGSARYLLPGFPSMVPTAAPGAECTELELKPGELLRVRKDHEPCAGTEIAVVLEDADSGTRVTIVQSGFGPWFDTAKDVILAHGREIVIDFQLYLERGIRVPPKNWGVDFGAMTRESDTGLVLQGVTPGGFAARVGMQTEDLLLTLRGVRIYNTQQLWTALALSQSGDEAEVSWARGRDCHRGAAAF
jgi:hypothetical protein